MSKWHMCHGSVPKSTTSTSFNESQSFVSIKIKSRSLWMSLISFEKNSYGWNTSKSINEDKLISAFYMIDLGKKVLEGTKKHFIRQQESCSIQNRQ